MPLDANLGSWPSLPRQRFQRKAAIQVLGISVISIVLASFCLYFGVRSVVQRDRENILCGAAHLLAADYDSQMDRWLSDFDQAVQFASSAIDADGENARSRRNPYDDRREGDVLDFILGSTAFDVALIVDRQTGKIKTMRSDHTLHGVDLQAMYIGDIVSGGQQWIQSLSQKSEIGGISCQRSPSHSHLPGYHIVFEAPIVNAPEMLFVAFLDCRALQNPLEQLKKSLSMSGFNDADLYLVDSSGKTLLSDLNPEMVGKQIDRDFSAVKDFQSDFLIRTLLGSPIVTSNTDDPAHLSAQSYRFNGRSKTSAFATISIPKPLQTRHLNGD